MSDATAPGRKPDPGDPASPAPPPVREPEPDRLPDEEPLPNPDEKRAPPKRTTQTDRIAMTKEIPPTKARQGRKGVQVLMVLIGGLLLAAVVWWAVEIYGSAIAPDEPVGGDPAGVEEFEETPAQ